MKKYFILYVFIVSSTMQASEALKSDNTLNQNKLSSSPKLKAGEYALFLDDKYTVFKTQKSDNLEFDLSCFKKNAKKPDCMALTYAKMKAENVETPHPSMNNMAAFHCTKMKGKNLIAIDAKHNEKDFCRFADNSMVSSWSMYLKHNPVPVIK